MRSDRGIRSNRSVRRDVADAFAAVCGVKVIGHGVEADGSFYCCAHCAGMAGASGVADRT